MKITEPGTTLTDYALAAVAIVLGLRLWLSETESISVTLCAIAFFVIAASAITGGTFHGFANWLSKSTRNAIWNVTVYLIGLAAGFMISGVATAVRWSDAAAEWLLIGLGIVVLSLAVQQSRWQLHRYLDHNGICHLIQIVGLYSLYWGASLIQ